VPLDPRLRRRLFVLALYAGLIALGWWISTQWERLEGAQISSMDPAMMFQILAVALIVFVITSAMPFIPGAEIGFG
jgi:hypothetical protein